MELATRHPPHLMCTPYAAGRVAFETLAAVYAAAESSQSGRTAALKDFL